MHHQYNGLISSTVVEELVDLEASKVNLASINPLVDAHDKYVGLVCRKELLELV